VPDVQRFAAHLEREFTAVRSFLFAPASVIRTASQRECNPHVVLASMLQVRTPHVVVELN
jgi:hypothetical protein